MAYVTISTPTSGSTVAHTFTADGTYGIAELLSKGKGDLVRSVVTHGTQTLDTKDCPLPPGAGGTWDVTHTVAGTETLTDCVVTATLVVNGVDAASDAVTNITITG